MLKIKYFDKNLSSGLSDFIQKSIALFEKRHSVFITIHAMSGRWYDANGSYLFPGWVNHRAEYCRKLRYEQKENNRQCMKHCAAGIEHECLKHGKPFCHACWKGVKELIVPFLWNGDLELVFYAGPFQGGEPPEFMRKDWEKLPQMPEEEKLKEMILELQMAAYSFYARFSEGNLRRDFPVPKRSEEIREYILQHACGDISLESLAKHLGLSPSRTSHLCVLLLGVTFQDQVTNVRMKKAEFLLETTDEPIKEIAMKTGFSDIYYFSRMFRNFFGIPPGAMRKNSRKKKNL